MYLLLSDCFVVRATSGNSEVILSIIIICCIYVACLTETGRTCFAGLWTRTRTFGISLSAMFVLFYVCFGGGGGGGSASLWWAGVPFS